MIIENERVGLEVLRRAKRRGAGGGNEVGRSIRKSGGMKRKKNKIKDGKLQEMDIYEERFLFVLAYVYLNLKKLAIKKYKRI